ncbi:MAG TPA: glutathione S-transferase family protein [Polyangia bacterium]|nr:glutathione S-transferase family protein [Polyangia bacterium]
MRILYHFQNSPYSRRVRLALAHKGLDAELRDGREHPPFLDEARRLSPLKTLPVLVEEDGRVIGDSSAITHYLDRYYPEAPALWPSARADAHRTFEAVALADAALEAIVYTGNRFFPLHEHAAWPAIKDDMVGRVQRALDALGDRASSLGRPTVAASGWSAADIWIYCVVDWLERLPVRAETVPLARQLVSIGWRLPPSLSRWADQHRARPEIHAL